MSAAPDDIPGESTSAAEHRRTTLRGLAVLFWVVLFGCALTLAVDGLGLKYVQGVIWPTDLHRFALREAPRGLDVAILGSSRASFGLTPAVLDACLESRLDRPTRTVNLARVFGTGHTMRALYRDLLHPDPPKLVVLAIAPEALDDTNPKTAASIAGTAGLADIPRELAEARNLPEALAALRPVARGAETLPFFLAGRHTEEERLQWIMDHHGGGQWCTGSDACDAQNEELASVMGRRWEQAVRNILSTIRDEHFGEYVAGEGRVHRAFLDVVHEARADGAQVAVVVMPLHEKFAAQIPPEARERFAATLELLARDHDLPIYRPDVKRWVHDQRSWVDPDHLARGAATDLSRAVCRDLLAPLLLDKPVVLPELDTRRSEDRPPARGERLRGKR